MSNFSSQGAIARWRKQRLRPRPPRPTQDHAPWAHPVYRAVIKASEDGYIWDYFGTKDADVSSETIEVRISSSAAAESMRGFVYFNTATLPKGAIVLDVEMRIYVEMVGTTPFGIVEVYSCKGCAGASLGVGDWDLITEFQSSQGFFGLTPGWGGLGLLPSAINTAGITNIMLRMRTDDGFSQQIALRSTEYPLAHEDIADRFAEPHLIIYYTFPVESSQPVMGQHELQTARMKARGRRAMAVLSRSHARYHSAPALHGLTLSSIAAGVPVLSRTAQFNRALSASTGSFVPGSTPLLDDFNRADGTPVDGSHPWLSFGAGVADIKSSQLSMTNDADAVWDQVFGADQEVYATVGNTSWPNQFILFFKIQGNTGSDPYADVYYSSSGDLFIIETYDGAAWTQRGFFVEPLTTGDKLSVRARANGMVEVYKNGVYIGGADISAWPQYANAGRIGVGWWGTNVTTFRVDDFGGGDTVLGGAIATVARVVARSRILTAAAAGAASIARIVAVARSLTASSVGVATLSRVAGRLRSLVATGIGVATLTRVAARLLTLSASGIGVAVLARATTLVRALVATGDGIATLARTALRIRTLAATGFGVATLTRALGFARSLAAAGVGVAALAATSARLRALAAVGVGVAALSRVASWGRSLAAAGVGTATLSRTASLFRTLSATGVGLATLVAAVARVMALQAAGVGVASLSRVAAYLRSLAATGTGVASLERVASFLRTLSAAAVGIATIVRGATQVVYMSATGVGVAMLERVLEARRTLAASGVGVAVVTRGMALLRSLAAAGAGVATLARTASLSRTLTAIGIGIASIFQGAEELLRAVRGITRMGMAALMRIGSRGDLAVGAGGETRVAGAAAVMRVGEAVESGIGDSAGGQVGRAGTDRVAGASGKTGLGATSPGDRFGEQGETKLGDEGTIRGGPAQ